MTPSEDINKGTARADMAAGLETALRRMRRAVEVCEGRRRGWLSMFGLLLVAVLGYGCGSLARPAPPPPPTPLDPPWDQGVFENHIEFLVAPSRSDAASQSPADLLVAYSAAQMEQANLQPGLSGSFRVPYATGTAATLRTSVRTPSGKSVAQVGEGTLRPLEGSALGQRTIVSVRLDGSPGDPTAAVLVRREDLAGGTMRKLADAGTRVVFVEGEASASRGVRPRGTPTEGLMGFRVGPAFREALQVGTEPGVAAVELATPWVVTVEPVATSPDVVNVLGYAPGKHPSLHRQLVIVCADLDAGVTDPLRVAGAAAVLGTSGQVGRFTRLWALPERTVLFALWSPGERGVEGLAAYLADPLWRLDQTVSVIYVGLEPEREDRARALLDEVGVPLRVLRVDTAAVSVAEATVAEGVDPVDRAAARAVRLARDAYAEVMAVSIQLPLVPVREDTLGVPAIPRPSTLQRP